MARRVSQGRWQGSRMCSWGSWGRQRGTVGMAGPHLSANWPANRKPFARRDWEVLYSIDCLRLPMQPCPSHRDNFFQPCRPCYSQRPPRRPAHCGGPCVPARPPDAACRPQGRVGSVWLERLAPRQLPFRASCCVTATCCCAQSCSNPLLLLLSQQRAAEPEPARVPGRPEHVTSAGGHGVHSARRYRVLCG